MSSAQAGLWYFCRHGNGNSVCAIPRVFEIDGPLDIARLRWSLSRVVERHEVLRTVFAESEGEPVQIIRPACGVDLPVINLAAGEIEAWVQQESARTIDLAEGPLLQMRLACTGHQRHVLLLLWHHIVSDQPSARILDEEIGEIYSGREPREPAVQYGDYAEWEWTRAQTRDSGKARDFWKACLAGAPPLIDLAFGRARPAEPGHKGHVQVFEIDPALARQIRAFSVKRRVTLFPVFLAAWALLLSRYSNRHDLVIGVPVSGRDVPELERVIGYFVNMLPLRLEVAPGVTFEGLVRDCWTRFLQCSRSALPFDAILDAVRPERNRSYSPLFQIVLNYLRERGDGLQLEGTNTRRISSHSGTSRPLDLTLTVVDRAPHLRIILEHNPALFDSRTIGQMAEHFLRILREATVPESLQLGEIGMLSSEERHTALIGRNATRVDEWDKSAEENQTVLTWFERSSRHNPDAAAIRSDRVEWLYRELSAFADCMHTSLKAQGIQPGDVVALTAERSPQTVGIILAIWKCGAIWLPVDPRWPKERAQFVVEDSAAKLVIDATWLQNNLRNNFSGTPSSTTATAGSIAYVIYTSGSTGQPKGVAIQHGSLLNCLLSMQRCPGVTATDTLLSVTPLSFDISLIELFLPLISGARLLLPNLETATSPRAVKRLLEKNEVTIMQATPAMWKSLVEEGWNKSPALRVWCGGETMPPELAELLLDRASEVWNLYGPTETTIWSTIHRVSRGESPVPIGRPIANTQCYVLDANIQPVPDGVAGELFIGGAGVSPGYRGQAQAQRDNFRPNPFMPGGTMYGTGDMVLWSFEGNLVFLHRRDTQVKVRGHRIELGEVETALSRLSMVQQAAVAVRDEALVAWVAPVAEEQWEPEQWRAQLRAQLPEYMVPGIFVPVDRFPLNSRGKVDRQRLPSPAGRTNRTRDDVANAASGRPSLVEQVLLDLWEDLLGVSPIGLHDNFFESGGHSLLATKMLLRIEKAFGRQLPDSILFQAPTIAGMAAHLRTEINTGLRCLVPIQPLGNRPIFFCVHAGCGRILSLRELGRSLGSDQPVYGLQGLRSAGGHAPHIRVEDTARDYIREIRALQPNGPYYLGGLWFGGFVAFEMAQQLTACGEQVAFVAILDAGVPPRATLRFAQNRDRILQLRRRAEAALKRWISMSAGERLSYLFIRIFRVWLAPLLFEAKIRVQPSANSTIPSDNKLAGFAHLVAEKRYRPVPYPNQITLFKADSCNFIVDPSFGWAAFAPNGLEIEKIPGDHTTMIQQPHVKVLAEKLKLRLRMAQAAGRIGPGQEEQ